MYYNEHGLLTYIMLARSDIWGRYVSAEFGAIEALEK
jgi:hypothetical protein